MEAKIAVTDVCELRDTGTVSTASLTAPNCDNKVNRELFHFKGCTLNKAYQSGIRLIQDKRGLPFDTCLIGNNDAKFIRIKTVHKWTTKLGYYEVDADTGEILGGGEYDTNELKKSNGKKIRVLDTFSKVYQPLYAARKISMVFHTFTRSNYAKIDFRRMLNNVRKRYSSLGYKVTGYVWTAEVSEGLHWHYHLLVSLDRRLRIKKVPTELRFEDLWGQRTEVEFVRYNVRHYMAKYFAKCNYRVQGTRSYGSSRKFELN